MQRPSSRRIIIYRLSLPICVRPLRTALDSLPVIRASCPRPRLPPVWAFRRRLCHRSLPRPVLHSFAATAGSNHGKHQESTSLSLAVTPLHTVSRVSPQQDSPWRSPLRSAPPCLILTARISGKTPPAPNTGQSTRESPPILAARYRLMSCQPTAVA